MGERKVHLVTGGTGIVGVHVIDALLSADLSVRALVRAGSDRSIIRHVLRHYHADGDARFDRIEWAEGDLHDVGALADAMQDVHHVYHAAALVSFDPRDRRALLRTNVEGTANVVNAALQSGVRRLCHVSSTATIGKATNGGMLTEDIPWDPTAVTSDYAASKHDAEMEVQRGIAEGLNAVIVNPCVVLGPGAPGRSSMALVERLRRGTRFHPPGSNAYVDARDVADGMLRVMDRGATGERHLLVGHNLEYRTLFGLFTEAFGKPAPRTLLRPWMLQLAWRAEWLRTRLTGRRALVTKATVNSALDRRSYSNAKICALTGQAVRPIADTVANVAAFVLKG
jgi:dihydroflavonol-4-reductase